MAIGMMGTYTHPRYQLLARSWGRVEKDREKQVLHAKKNHGAHINKPHCSYEVEKITQIPYYQHQESAFTEPVVELHANPDAIEKRQDAWQNTCIHACSHPRSDSI
jgi:hypothetical protein